MGNTNVKPFTPSKPGDGLRAFADDAATIPAPLGGNALLGGIVPSLHKVKPVSFKWASLTTKQVQAFCDHIEIPLRARACDAHTFTLLTDSQFIICAS